MPGDTPPHSRPAERVYEIRAVSRLTGVQPVTLRAWERRYGAVQTRRTETGGRRLYSEEDVQRLSLIKSLVDLGEAVSQVAVLPTAELSSRLEQAMTACAVQPRHARLIRIGVFGPRLAAMLHGDFSHRGIEVVRVHRDPGACRSLPADVALDAVLLEFTGVHEETREEVLACMQRAGARRAVVMYDFGNLASVASLNVLPITALRGPAEAAELARACVAVTSPSPAPRTLDPLPEPVGRVPERRYSTARLDRLRETAARIDCECPRHLATLVGQLYAFEDYSAECASRNAEDARMHAYLHQAAGSCRAGLEDALERLIRFEGLEN